MDISNWAHTSEITFYRVKINNNTMGFPDARILNGAAGIVSIVSNSRHVKINMYMVNFISNKYPGHPGDALYIFDDGRNIDIVLQECQFISNKSPGHGAVLYIYREVIQPFDSSNIQIVNAHFDQNIAGSSVVYITHSKSKQSIYQLKLHVNTSMFTNNVASSLHLPGCDVKFSGVLLFKNNIAEKGGAMYLDQGTMVTIKNEANIQFIANTATLNGGAIYVDLLCDYLIGYTNTFSHGKFSNYSAIFINNSARVAGNSLCFKILFSKYKY